MKIIIPMAGLGSRFASHGYAEPKPLIQFKGKTMIRHVVEHLDLLEHEHIFICQKQHVADYNLHNHFDSFVPNFKIVTVNGLTDGAATTVSKVDGIVDYDDEVMIVNSDQLLHWDKNLLAGLSCAGTIFCFYGTGPKWSYAKVDEIGFVTKVAEKIQISEYATAGMYQWNKFGYYMESYYRMVAANDRTNNEFYVAPVYNYALHMGIGIRMVNYVDQVGTPEELEEYLNK